MEKEHFMTMLDSVITGYEQIEGDPFVPPSYDYYALKNFMESVEEQEGALLFSFEAWDTEGIFCAYYSDKIGKMIIIDPDAKRIMRPEDTTDFKDMLWSYQEQCALFEASLFNHGPNCDCNKCMGDNN